MKSSDRRVLDLRMSRCLLQPKFPIAAFPFVVFSSLEFPSSDHVAMNLFDLMLLTLATSGDNGTKSTSWTRGFQPSTWIKCYSGDCWLEIRAIEPDAVMRGGYVAVQTRSEATAWTPSTREQP
ncbi:hypothetical protein NL676_039436 [Syzygium grande]|nr:hypothetical protein NL676_039435 [Syzygium grande]KAI6678640.1 hypothetical protein NL676_039436 [Syzygium grande]